MGGEDRWQGIALAPVNTEIEEEQWRNFNNSVNAVSLGFVATAVLISMFLVMAIFERFFRPRSSQLTTSARTAATTHLDLQAQITNNDSKLDRHNSHKRSICDDAWRRYAYLHCTSCSCTVSARAHRLASPSTQTALQFHLQLNCKPKQRHGHRQQNLVLVTSLSSGHMIEFGLVDDYVSVLNVGGSQEPNSSALQQSYV